MNFPPDSEIVGDSVYGNSKLLDGRRFAEEFVRRRKLADKGQVAPDGTGNFLTAGSSGESDGKPPGGWSEVAKKGGEKSGAREDATAFKVVAAKKKGKR
jgi:PERQ amino acid-rich with GYF domain-containing protein